MQETEPSNEAGLVLSEIFSSIQGEGTRAGLPCLFLRLTGCNLRCRWCDTAWAWTGGERMALPEIIERVRLLGLPLVELTGGEPLLQGQAPALMRRLLELDYEVLIETNGSIDLSLVPQGVHAIMDLKPPSSGESHRNLMENLTRLRPGDELKIVIADLEDYLWAREIARSGRIPSGIPLLLSPLAGPMKPAELAAWILADRLNARFQLQLHKILWPGVERGV